MYSAGSADPKIVAYLDGNSLGRPLKATQDRISRFVEDIWGSRLIRAWDEGWMDDPVRIGNDIGRVVNPLIARGQVEGGAVQGIGQALCEQVVYDAGSGQLLTGSFMDYDIPKIDTVPTVETILIEKPSPHNTFGARGIGEPPITAGAAAIANAVRDASGARVLELPIRAESVWRALHGNGAQ